MELNTSVKTKSSQWKLGYDAQFAAIGSCFSDHMAERLGRFRFAIDTNPNGIVFHPLPAGECLLSLRHSRYTNLDELVSSYNGFISLQHHGAFRHDDANQLLTRIQEKQSMFENHVAKSNVLMVTFGSAWGYEYIPTRQVVANCHKLPGHFFRKLLSERSLMLECWQEVVRSWSIRNPQLRFVFTVSPVRHVRDGLIENQRSKARLIELAHEICDTCEGVEYFPAYEIMVDELRDYRFYERDMIHPSELAVDIIWQRWTQSYLTRAALETMAKLEPLLRMLEHRGLHETTTQTDARMREAEAKIAQVLGAVNGS